MNQGDGNRTEAERRRDSYWFPGEASRDVNECVEDVKRVAVELGVTVATVDVSVLLLDARRLEAEDEYRWPSRWYVEVATRRRMLGFADLGLVLASRDLQHRVDDAMDWDRCRREKARRAIRTELIHLDADRVTAGPTPGDTDHVDVDRIWQDVQKETESNDLHPSTKEMLGMLSDDFARRVISSFKLVDHDDVAQVVRTEVVRLDLGRQPINYPESYLKTMLRNEAIKQHNDCKDDLQHTCTLVDEEGQPREIADPSPPPGKHLPCRDDLLAAITEDLRRAPSLIAECSRTGRRRTARAPPVSAGSWRRGSS